MKLRSRDWPLLIPGVFARDILHIAPDIKMTEEGTDPARFSYYWILYQSAPR